MGEMAKTRVIIGMGATGLSCARYFAARKVAFRIADSRTNPPMRAQFDQEFPGIPKACGEFHVGDFSANECLVVSPGVAITEPAITAALQAGATLTSDIEIFLSDIDGPVVGITGANGKSTVTTLVANMLEQAGLRVCMAGNIGLPVLDRLLEGKVFDVYVLELSSFQLERLPRLGAEVATILNITEDHMDRYASFADYQVAKQRVYLGARHCVVNRDDPLTDCVVDKGADKSSFGFSLPTAGNFGLEMADGKEWIAFGSERLIETARLGIHGRHNVANAMAALAIGHALGVAWQPMLETLQTFRGLRHRCEWVANVGGMDFYNDSKATNVGAAVAAISGFSRPGKKNLILIAGGLDKDSDFAPLNDAVRESVKKVFLIGKDAKKIEDALGSALCCYSSDLSAAVRDAARTGSAGDVVLLAPACASFDMFKNFEHRGDEFIAAVKGLAGGGA